MDAATHNSSFLLASLTSGQGTGMSAAGSSQAVDNYGKSGRSSFSSSFDQSTQALQSEAEQNGPLRAVNGLLTEHAATTGTGLPLLEGQGVAADMSNEDVLSLISQLQGEGAEALVNRLASLLQGQSGLTGSKLATSQQAQQVDAVFANIRQLLGSTGSSGSSSQLSQTMMANLGRVEQLAQQSQSAGVAKFGMNLRQAFTESGLSQTGERNDSVSNSVIARDFTGNAVVTPMPVLLDRMSALSNERQLSAGLLDSLDTTEVPDSIVQLGKTAGLQASSGSRPMSSFIQAPLAAPQWQSEFGDRLMMMSRVATQGQNQVAEIRLNPAHLGPIEVRVVMKDDLASITFSAQHGVVRDAIESSLPRLREMFNNSGLMLADANVSEHSLRDQHKQGRDSETGDQHGMTDTDLSMNEQTKLISQIDLSAVTSARALDLYA